MTVYNMSDYITEMDNNSKDPLERVHADHAKHFLARNKPLRNIDIDLSASLEYNA